MTKSRQAGCAKIGIGFKDRPRRNTELKQLSRMIRPWLPDAARFGRARPSPGGVTDPHRHGRGFRTQTCSTAFGMLAHSWQGDSRMTPGQARGLASHWSRCVLLVTLCRTGMSKAPKAGGLFPMSSESDCRVCGKPGNFFGMGRDLSLRVGSTPAEFPEFSFNAEHAPPRRIPGAFVISPCHNSNSNSSGHFWRSFVSAASTGQRTCCT